MHVTEAVRQRISTRAFLNRPIGRALNGAEMLETCSKRAPSGGTCSLGGGRRGRRGEGRDHLDGPPRPRRRPEWAQCPATARSIPTSTRSTLVHNTSRRKRVGEMMYDKVGIPKEDRAGRLRWFANNYQFFGAPVGLFLIIDRRIGHGQWAHMGMFMQTIALLAEERGRGYLHAGMLGAPACRTARPFRPRRKPYGLCRHRTRLSRSGRTANELYAERAPQSEIVEFRGF